MEMPWWIGIVWWVGAIHLAIYGVAGGLVVVTVVTVKSHQMAKVMGRIIQWHWARHRWQQGEIDREPKP